MMVNPSQADLEMCIMSWMSLATSLASQQPQAYTFKNAAVSALYSLAGAVLGSCLSSPQLIVQWSIISSADKIRDG
jgi:hypothetical protein